MSAVARALERTAAWPPARPQLRREAPATAAVKALASRVPWTGFAAAVLSAAISAAGALANVHFDYPPLRPLVVLTCAAIAAAAAIAERWAAAPERPGRGAAAGALAGGFAALGALV